MRRLTIGHGFLTDIRLAARRLAATPLFTIFSILSLAVGVSVTTAFYSVVKGIFLKDLGIHDAARIAFVVTPFDGRLTQESISDSDFRHLRTTQTSFADLSASSRLHLPVRSTSTTEMLAADAVDGAYFATLGVDAAIGRVLTRADDEGRAEVVVLSHQLWRGRFSADPHVVGRTLRVSGRPFTIIGVAPAAFAGTHGPILAARLWIPLSAASLPQLAAATGSGDRRHLRVFGRLAASVSVETASAELAAIAAQLDATAPTRTGPSQRAGWTDRPWKAKTAAAVVAEDEGRRRIGFLLIALVALVLVVASTNLANLVLARGTTRQQELTVRYALGASRWRLVREQSAESVLIALGGAVTAYMLFHGLRALMTVEFNLPLPMGGRFSLAIEPALDPQVIGIAAATLLMSLLVFGLEPAVQLTRSGDLRGQLAAGAGVGRRRAGRQRMLLRWQVAVSAGFFIVATMFVKYTVAEARHDPGLNLDRLAVAVLTIDPRTWDEARVRRTVDRVVEEAQKAPGIETVSVSTGMPFGVPGMVRLQMSLPGSAVNDVTEYPTSALIVSPLFFRTIGVPIVRGRSFDERDHAGATPVAIVSELTAKKLFGTNDGVGRQLRLQPSSVSIATVIGVARDTDVGRLNDRRPLVYLPFAQRYSHSLTIAARPTGDTAAAVQALRESLHRDAPDLAVDLIGTGRAVLSGPIVFLRAMGLSTLALGALTLILAMAGLFGIQTHIVGQRTQEIGVRMSLGATAGRIKRMVLLDGYRPVFDGLALGLAGGLAGRMIVRAYLDIDVTVVDPWMLLVVPIPLILAALCACYLPAHRASRVEPSVALRHV